MDGLLLDTPLLEFDGSTRKLFVGLSLLAKVKRGRLPPVDHPYWDSTECAQEISDMCQVLHESSPPGYYFGANIWDCFSIGYWRST